MLPTCEYKSQVYGQQVDLQVMPCLKLPVNSNTICRKQNLQTMANVFNGNQDHMFKPYHFFLFTLRYTWMLLSPLGLGQTSNFKRGELLTLILLTYQIKIIISLMFDSSEFVQLNL